MFKITGGKGFHIEFENGYTVSVQFGAGNYCDNYEADFSDQAENGKRGSSDAECAVWGKDGNFIDYADWGDGVGARMAPKDVLDLLIWAEAQPSQ